MIFRKKTIKREVETPYGEFVPLCKNLRSASLEPIPYKHTDKFIKDGEDPLSFERERISLKDVDFLLAEQRVPAIRADTRLEIEEGKRQYTDHIYAVQKVIDIEKGEMQRVIDIRQAVIQEIKEYDRLIEELLANSREIH